MASNNYTGYYGTQYTGAAGYTSSSGQMATYPTVTNASYVNSAYSNTYQTATDTAGQRGYATVPAASGQTAYATVPSSGQTGYAAVPAASGQSGYTTVPSSGQSGYTTVPSSGQSGYGSVSSSAQNDYTSATAARYNYDYSRSLQSTSSVAAGYGYDYSRTYDASKTYYQTSNTYGSATAASGVGGESSYYSATSAKNSSTGASMEKSGGVGKAAAASETSSTSAYTYSSYDAALYNAASLYVAQQQTGSTTTAARTSTGWGQYKSSRTTGTGNRGRIKSAPKPQHLHYCDVCKISCPGPQTYREHLEGQKHKKRQASFKMLASAQATTQNRGHNHHCDLCDVTCNGNDAYAAHVRGSKHQKVIKLHQTLGKPIPNNEQRKMAMINFVPASSGDTTLKTTASAQKDGTDVNMAAKTDSTKSEEGTPVGGEYIYEVKEDGKILSFNCKLCDCKCNDNNAKEMHMKGRRHRLQYKRKVQPDLVSSTIL